MRNIVIPSLKEQIEIDNQQISVYKAETKALWYQCGSLIDNFRRSWMPQSKCIIKDESKYEY